MTFTMTATWASRLAALTLLFAGAAPAANAAPEPLRVGMIPDAGATQVSIEEKAPLQAYLERQLGRPVKLIIPTNYNATVEGLGNGSLDIAYLGGLTFVKAKARYQVLPLVQRDVDQRFHSLFITHEGSGITKLADLRGKTFCFGDINSTSGHLYPYLMMKQVRIEPDKALKSFRYTGSHPATAEAVSAGVCDAGAIDETVFKTLVAQGKISGDKVKVFAVSQPFADYVWVGRKGLDAHAAKAFSAALLRLKPAQDAQVLSILRGDHYVQATAAEYGEVERVAKELGLM